MKKIPLLLLPFFLAACLGKTTTPTIPEPVVSSEIAPIVESEKIEPPIQTTPTPEKPVIPKKTTPTQQVETKTENNTDDITAELDKLIDDIVGG